MRSEVENRLTQNYSKKNNRSKVRKKSTIILVLYKPMTATIVSVPMKTGMIILLVVQWGFSQKSDFLLLILKWIFNVQHKFYTYRIIVVLTGSILFAKPKVSYSEYDLDVQSAVSLQPVLFWQNNHPWTTTVNHSSSRWKKKMMRKI